MRTSLRVSSTSEAGLLALLCLDDPSNNCSENLILIPVLPEDLFFLAAGVRESGNVINDSRNTSYNGLYYTLCLVSVVIKLLSYYNQLWILVFVLRI